MTLERLWQQGEEHAVLTQLVAAWRTHHHPALATLIDRLRREPPPALGADRSTRAAAVKRIWREASILDAGHAMRSLFTLPPEDARALLRRRGPWFDDPRTVTVALEAIASPPKGYVGVGALPFWTDLLRALQPLDDARIPEALERERAAARTLGSVLERWPIRVRPVPTEPPDLAALVAWSTRLEQTDDRAALFARVYADPGDDGVRAVLGDRLIQEADPRGLAIARELAGRSSAQLYREHGASWMGPLAPMVSWASFRLGFPEAVRLRSGVPLVLDPAWRTVRSVDLQERQDAAALLGFLPLLDEVLGAATLQGIPRHLRSLGVLVTAVPLGGLQVWDWPELRELTLVSRGVLRAPQPLPGAQLPLERLVLQTDDVRHVASAQQRPGAFPIRVRTPDRWGRTLLPSAAGPRSHLVLQSPAGVDGTVLGSLRTLLQGADTALLEDVVLDLRATVTEVQRAIALDLFDELCPGATLHIHARNDAPG